MRIAFYEIAVNAATMVFFVIIGFIADLIELRKIKRAKDGGTTQ